MKKLLSLILTITILCSMAITAFAEKIQNYEYILPMEYSKIERYQNCYIAYDKQDKCAIYNLNGKKLSDDYDYISKENPKRSLLRTIRLHVKKPQPFSVV